jgi:hypothetical protein
MKEKAVARLKYPMNRTILKHLLECGSITNVEAQAVHKCRALPRRIADLKEAGVPINKETRVDSTGQRYVRYWIDKLHADYKPTTWGVLV